MLGQVECITAVCGKAALDCCFPMIGESFLSNDRASVLRSASRSLRIWQCTLGVIQVEDCVIYLCASLGMHIQGHQLETAEIYTLQAIRGGSISEHQPIRISR